MTSSNIITGKRRPLTQEERLQVNPVEAVITCIPLSNGGFETIRSRRGYPQHEETMYNETQAAKQRLTARLLNISCDVEASLQRKYGLIDNVAPRTAQELVDAITSKKFELPQKDEPHRTWFGIKWRDPNVKRDDAGFIAAVQKLTDALERANDEVAVLTPAEGLKSLRDLEAFTKELLA